MTTQVKSPDAGSSATDDVHLDHRFIGSRKLRVELPKHLHKSVPERLCKEVGDEIHNIVRVKLTSHGALLMTLRTRCAQTSEKDKEETVQSVLSFLKHKIEIAQRTTPGTMPQRRRKGKNQSFVNDSRRARQALITT